MYCCTVKSLIDSCTHPGDNPVNLWSLSAEQPIQDSSMASLNGVLVCFGGGDFFTPSSKIHAYSPLTHVEDMAVKGISVTSAVLPNEGLVVFGGIHTGQVFKASLK